MKKGLLYMFSLLVLCACISKSSQKVRVELQLYDPQFAIRQIQITNLTSNQKSYFEFEAADELLNVLQAIEMVENTKFVTEQVINKTELSIDYQVSLFDANEEEVSSFELAGRYFLRYKGIWYENPEFTSLFDHIRESYLQSLFSKWPYGQTFASYLKVPSSITIQMISDLNIKSQEGYRCNYRDIFRMEVNLIKQLCFLDPGSILEDKKTMIYQLSHVDGLSSLFDQLYQAMFLAEPQLDQKYAHILSKMGLAPENEYRERVVTSNYDEYYQCGIDISLLTLDELIEETQYMIKVKATKNSSSFLRKDRWPEQFPIGDDLVISSFPFVVLESYYGRLNVGDVGELVYFGGEHDGKLMDCVGTYEDYSEGEEFLILAKSSNVYPQDNELPLFSEVHYLHDSLMKIDIDNRIRQVIDWRRGRYFNSGVDVKEVIEYLITKKGN